jgi:hypothetical protein
MDLYARFLHIFSSYRIRYKEVPNFEMMPPEGEPITEL